MHLITLTLKIIQKIINVIIKIPKQALSPNKLMTISNPKYEKMMKQLSSLTFEPKGEICALHRYREYQYICSNSKCKSYMSLFCGDCDHAHSHLLEYKRGTTVLKSFLQQKWDKIQQYNYNLSSIYTACDTNIQYCKDILTQISTQIQKSKQKISHLPTFQHLLTSLLQIHENSKDNRRIGEILGKIDSQYQLFQRFGDKDKDTGKEKEKEDRRKKQIVVGVGVDRELEARQDKWVRVGEDIKKFTEKMLAFIDKLRSQFKISKAEIQRNRQANQSLSKKLANLWQILQQAKSKKPPNSNPNNTNPTLTLDQNLTNLPCLVIELPSQKPTKSSLTSFKQKQLIIEEQSMLINENLQKFRNLTSIVIKNKNGRIGGKMWEGLTRGFEDLKFLRELWLNIRLEDLRLLTKLFRERANAVRSISILHLTITDEPKLDLKQIAQFCNTLQLRQLHLVLPRNNIPKTSFTEFTKLLRFRTSLSSLPMDVLDINLTKNKINDQVDINQCTLLFQRVYQGVKGRKIVF